MDDDGIDDLTAYLEGIAEDLADATPFFAAHEARYLEIARNAAYRVLVANRPQMMDPDVWQERAVDFCELVFSLNLPGAFEIVYAGTTEFRKMGLAAVGANPGNVTAITYQDVLDWVNAGPEESGKDVTAIESARDRSPEQIAYDVHNAIVQYRLGGMNGNKDFSRIEARLEEWVNGRAMEGDLGDLMEKILAAWENDLAPVIDRDFEEWVSLDVIGEA